LCYSVEKIRRECEAGTIICAGVGAGLLSDLFGGRNLARNLGDITDALPAFAVREVALRKRGS